MDEKAKAITTLIVDALVVINMAAQAFGWSPVAYDQASIYTVVSAVLTIAAVVYTWWKNQNITSASTVAQRVVDALKDGTVTTDEVLGLFASPTKADETDVEKAE